MKNDIKSMIDKLAVNMPFGQKVFISPKPEVLSLGTIETEHGTIHMSYDPMISSDSCYLMNKDDYDRLRKEFK